MSDYVIVSHFFAVPSFNAACVEYFRVFRVPVC